MLLFSNTEIQKTKSTGAFLAVLLVLCFYCASAQFQYKLPSLRVYNSIDVTTKVQAIETIYQFTSEVNGCVYISSPVIGLDTIISIKAKQPHNLKVVNKYGRDTVKINPAKIPSTQLNSTVPVGLTVFYNQQATIDTNVISAMRGSRQRNYCYLKFPSEGFSIRDVEQKDTAYKMAPVVSKPFMKDVFIIRSLNGTPIHEARGNRGMVFHLNLTSDTTHNFKLCHNQNQKEWIFNASATYLLVLEDSLKSCYDVKVDKLGDLMHSDSSTVLFNFPGGNFTALRSIGFLSYRNGSRFDSYKYLGSPLCLKSDRKEKNLLLALITNQTDDKLEKFQYFEQALPRSHAAQKYWLSVPNPLDSIIAAVTFWQDSTLLEVNNQPLGYFNADTMVHLHLSQSSLIEGSNDIQVQAGTFSDTNLRDQSSYFTYFSGNSAGVGYRVDHPEDYIKQSIFKPKLQVDQSAKAHLNITCKTEHIDDMIMNGKTVPASAFSPFMADGSYSFADIALSKDSTYHLQNKGGFMGVLYTKAVKKGGFVSTYALTLSETPDVNPQEFENMGWRYPGDTSWNYTKELTACTSGEIEVKLPQYRFTKWQLSRPMQGDTNFNVGEEAPAIREVQIPAVTGDYYVTVCDSSSCYGCDSLLIKARPFRINSSKEQIIQTCEGFKLAAKLKYRGSFREATWWVNGEEVKGQTGDQISYVLEGDDLNQDRLNLEVFAKGYGCDTVLTKDIALENIESEAFPNVFTPNGDGVNDCLKFGDFGQPDCMQVKIYNRYGKQLWMNTNQNCWDGKVNGSDVPEGVYYYVLKVGASEFTGFFHLHR